MYHCLIGALGRVLSDIQSHNQSADKDSQSEQGKEWSKPMSKTRMMTALGMYSTDTFNSYRKAHRHQAYQFQKHTSYVLTR
jgi:hypothetical protein